MEHFCACADECMQARACVQAQVRCGLATAAALALAPIPWKQEDRSLSGPGSVFHCWLCPVPFPFRFFLDRRLAGELTICRPIGCLRSSSDLEMIMTTWSSLYAASMLYSMRMCAWLFLEEAVLCHLCAICNMTCLAHDMICSSLA